jgi:hypothetical protein
MQFIVRVTLAHGSHRELNEMKTIRRIMATTRVDLHGDRFALAALESMRDHIRSAYLPFIYNHDPRCPPLGRVFAAEIVNLEDGEHALEAEVELFEQGPLPPLVGDRSIVARELSAEGLLLTIDRTFSLPEFEEPVASIAALFGKPPQLEVKKALDPIAVFGISAGLFVVGKFAGAFFARLGTDAAAALSAKLKEVFAHREAKQTRLLRFEFEHKGQRCRADVILSAPSDGDIDGFLADGLRQLDAVLPSCVDQIDGLVRYVFTYSAGEVKLEFAVRRDAVPVFPVAPITSTEQLPS